MLSYGVLRVILHLAVLLQYQLVTDRRTDRRTHYDSICLTGIALRGTGTDTVTYLKFYIQVCFSVLFVFGSPTAPQSSIPAVSELVSSWDRELSPMTLIFVFDLEVEQACQMGEVIGHYFSWKVTVHRHARTSDHRLLYLDHQSGNRLINWYVVDITLAAVAQCLSQRTLIRATGLNFCWHLHYVGLSEWRWQFGV